MIALLDVYVTDLVLVDCHHGRYQTIDPMVEYRLHSYTQNTYGVNNGHENQYQSFFNQKQTFQTRHDQELDLSLHALK